MAIALWYCPPQGSVAYETLQMLIFSFQTLFPDSPVFEPHVTVTSHLVCNSKDDVNKILTSCVAAIQSIRSHQTAKKGRKGQASHTVAAPLVSFNGCSVGKQYFKKIVLECNKNKILYGVAQVMREMYVEIDPETRSSRAATWVHEEFHPHVSLLYSDIHPVSQASLRVVQQRIEDALDVQLVPREKRKGSENADGSNEVQMRWDFDVSSSLSWNIPGTFKVVNCVGPVQEWEVLGRVDV
ncbi:AIF_collapsed_G0019400.mRNA.1.CDS.1 [Saccharomyces cerevisiae]|nr:AIF_HP2_G0021650.mRNA.1.CDS.1 [Saccharomyces cerevisiae]CAI6516965.1 AIF_HP1_G0019030.mRNA.1.CDS.1 [Saccharomyces cerevisiae]CAI6530588.1 AIF_HP2_G0021650.mRNA.1.CDS.1 [Saccharomyces cerevisiae]CAI6669114.1 AIF_collapsed_G0019400.mRNA.1.CDS.1 [Saccharomyces cerevisiae]